MTADASGPESSAEDDVARLTDAQRSLRAQMLATEHWSLLASRSTTQSEVLTRIAIFLTLVSAGLVTLGVLGNATQFSGWFGVAALGVLFLLVLLGLITPPAGVQHGDGGPDVRARDESPAGRLPRSRSGHRAVLPHVGRRRPAGAERTYHYFFARGPSQVFASSMMIITVVTAAVAGLFAGSLAVALGGSVGVAVTIGIVVGLALFVGFLTSRVPPVPRARGASHVPLRTHRTAARESEPLRPSAAAR